MFTSFDLPQMDFHFSILYICLHMEVGMFGCPFSRTTVVLIWCFPNILRYSARRMLYFYTWYGQATRIVDVSTLSHVSNIQIYGHMWWENIITMKVRLLWKLKIFLLCQLEEWRLNVDVEDIDDADCTLEGRAALYILELSTKWILFSSICI